MRRVYLDNVVNFDICSYESTDVRGVGELERLAVAWICLDHLPAQAECSCVVGRAL